MLDKPEMTLLTADRKLFVVGLVGGVASGKSQVARMFQSQGAAIIDADVLGHAMLQRPVVARRLSQLFGPNVLDSDGQVNRGELAKLVFGADEQASVRLEQLEQVVHPLIHAEALKLLRQFQHNTAPPAAVIVDAPLLLEAGWAEMCDVILFIDTPLELRLERAKQRGWSADHFAAREQSQLGLEEKRQAATHFISGALDDKLLSLEVASLLQEMR